MVGTAKDKNPRNVSKNMQEFFKLLPPDYTKAKGQHIINGIPVPFSASLKWNYVLLESVHIKIEKKHKKWLVAAAFTGDALFEKLAKFTLSRWQEAMRKAVPLEQIRKALKDPKLRWRGPKESKHSTPWMGYRSGPIQFTLTWAYSSALFRNWESAPVILGNSMVDALVAIKKMIKASQVLEQLFAPYKTSKLHIQPGPAFVAKDVDSIKIQELSSHYRTLFFTISDDNAPTAATPWKKVNSWEEAVSQAVEKLSLKPKQPGQEF
jgi:hypothetical protein